MPRRIEVEIIGDSRSLERAFSRSARSATKFEATMRGTVRGLSTGFKTLAATFGIGFGLDTLIELTRHSLDAAENLNKEVSKTKIVFGASEHAVESWAKTTADALGIDEAAALKAASNFGSLFNQLRKGTGASADMSKRLVEVGADLASFFHVSSSNVLATLTRALYGQARGAKALGINLSNTRVQTEAYADGIAHTGSKLTEAQKVAARYNIILRDAAPAFGNATAHAKDWANVQGRLKAELEDTFAAIGEKLLPVFKRLAERFEQWLANGDNQKRLVSDLTGLFEGLAKAIEGVAAAWDKIHDVSSWFDKHHLGFLNKGALQDVKDLRNWMRGTGGGGGGRFAPNLGAWFGQPIPTGLPTDVPGYEWTMKSGRPPGTTTVVGGTNKGPTGAAIAAQRNTWFDNMIARQLDRVQDLSLRKQLARLRGIAAEVRERIAGTKDTTRRLTLEDKLLEILRQEKQVQADITDQIKQANQALKDRAEAIKSAILDRLQRKQTDVENKRALQDAKEQLRLALALGGPKGIRAGRRAVADALMAQRIAAVERAHPSLTAGGRFALGNIITINVHGVTDPEAVARRVTAILNKRARHTTGQTRGPGAGATAGTH